MPVQVQPYKFEPITFELRYDKSVAEITNLIINIISNKKAIEKIHIIPNWVEAINEKVVKQLMIKSIHGTLAIEGNTSTEKEIEKILSEEDLRKIKERKDIETYNIKQVYDYINNFKKPGKDKPLLITEELIKELHRVITDRTFENGNVPGQYRNFEVRVGDQGHGGVYRPPHILDDIKMLMKGLAEWLNSEEILKEYPFMRAILAHYYLEIIHPFGDGNGRTGRALESLILHDFGFRYGSSFALWIYYYSNYDKYFSLFSKTRKENKGDQTEFIIFSLSVLDSALENVFEEIINITDRLLFKDYLSYLVKNKKINSRQHVISELILTKDSISVEELNSHPLISTLYIKKTPRTFQRDIKGLLETHQTIVKKVKDEKVYYEANIEGLINKYDRQ
jgi:Fic family protein